MHIVPRNSELCLKFDWFGKLEFSVLFVAFAGSISNYEVQEVVLKYAKDE